MKKIITIIIVLLLLPTLVLAQNIPKPYGYVNDYADVLSNDAELNQILTSLQEETTAEVVIVTTDSEEVVDSNSYATELFNEWGIGKADKDNGLLILLDMHNRRIEVEVGYGLEGILNDAKVGRILDQYAVPYLSNNSYSEGMYSFVSELSNIIVENKEEVISGQRSVDVDTFFPVFFVFIFFIIPALGAVSYKIFTPKCPDCKVRMKYIGKDSQGEYYLVHYKCPKCGKTKTVKKKKQRGAFIFVGGAGGHGSGFGGFGGGGSGGGGAGRGF